MYEVYMLRKLVKFLPFNLACFFSLALNGLKNVVLRIERLSFLYTDENNARSRSFKTPGTPEAENAFNAK